MLEIWETPLAQETTVNWPYSKKTFTEFWNLVKLRTYKFPRNALLGNDQQENTFSVYKGT